MACPASRWRAFALLSVLAVPALLLAACGGDSESTPAPASSAPATSGAEATSTPPSTPTPVPYPTAPSFPGVARARITTDNLNVRVGPDIRSPAIGLLQPNDDLEIAGRSADSQWLAIVNTGWVVYRADWVQLSTDVRTLPEVNPREFVPAMQPPGTSSGLPAVDVVVDAVLASDVGRLVRLANTLQLQCEAQPGMGGPPPCSVRPCTTPGTTVEVFPTAVCEGEHVLADRLTEVFTRFYVSAAGSAPAPARLYAVVQAPAQQSAFFPEGKWVAIFALPDGTGRAVGINEQGIARVDFPCDALVTDMLQRRPLQDPVYVLPPRVTPPVRPRP